MMNKQKNVLICNVLIYNLQLMINAIKY